MVPGVMASDVVVWESGAERWFGWGVADEVIAANHLGAAQDRYKAVRDACASVSPVAASPAENLQVRPRWFGGFSFDPTENEPDAEWRSFGTGSFVLPQVVAQRSGSARTRWFVTLAAEDWDELQTNAAVTLVQHLWDSVDVGSVEPAVGPVLAVATGAPGRRMPRRPLQQPAET